MNQHIIVNAAGVSIPALIPQSRHKLVFHFLAANTAATQFEIFHTKGSDATGCLPDANFVKRNADTCTCPNSTQVSGTLLLEFTANGAVATGNQIAVVAGARVEVELQKLADWKWFDVRAVAAAAGVVVTLETYS
jgi:hypothetical protein